MTKIIHVHLTRDNIRKRRDWYFGSITAIYSVFSEEEIGFTKNYLLHAGLSGNGTVFSKNAIIKQSKLIRATFKHKTNNGSRE